MRMNDFEPNSFDDHFKISLQKHIVNVPEDFAQRLLTRIQRQEYAAALAAIKMRERLLIAAMVLVPVCAIIVLLLAGPEIMAQINSVIAGGRQLIVFDAAKTDFVLRHWLEIAIVAASLIYILFDQVLADN
jgi:hypothetical protein